MPERAAARVTVHDVVGLPFPDGRDLAHEAGLVLAGHDPDGPPIGALTWPGPWWITTQSPAPGTVLWQWDSVRVEVSAQGDAPSGAVPAPPRGPHDDRAHAGPETVSVVDLGGSVAGARADGPAAAG